MARKPRVPSYRHHKATGRAVVTINGRDHYLGPYNSPESRERYQRLIAEYLAGGGLTRRKPAGASYTVAELAAAYLEWARSWYVKGGRPTGQLERVTRSVGVATGLYAGLPADRFGPLCFKAVRQEMVNRGWTRTHVNHCAACVARMFKWATSEEMIPVSVYEALRTVAGLARGRTAAREGRTVLPVPPGDVEPVLALCSPVVADMARLQLLTGARGGEICQLRPCDLDRTGRVWLYRPRSHKTEHHGHGARVLFIGPRAQAILAPYLDRPAEAHCFSPREAMERAGGHVARLNREAVGDRYTSKTYGHAIYTACRRYNRRCDELEAGARGMGQTLQLRRIPPWSCHQLRHSAATALVEQFGWDTARIILGHRSVNVTRLYAEDDTRKAAEAMGKVG